MKRKNIIRRSERIRKTFFNNVNFANMDSEKSLMLPIYMYCNNYTFSRELITFKELISYINHIKSTELGDKFDFLIHCPIVISGTNISDMHIIDAKGNSFNLSLLPCKFVYYEENNKYSIPFHVIKKHHEKGKNIFSEYSIDF